MAPSEIGNLTMYQVRMFLASDAELKSTRRVNGDGDLLDDDDPEEEEDKPRRKFRR